MTAPLDVGRMLSAQARLQPGRLAARDLERTLTYRQWNARACRLANALLGLGLAHGDRVAVLAYNRIEWAEIYAAVAKAGLVAVPVNFRLSAPEVGYILEDCAVAAVLVEEALVDVIDEIRASLPLTDDRYLLIGNAPNRAGYRAYEGLIEQASSREPEQAVAPEDSWCLMYTSGTTGRPKGAIRNHGSSAMIALMTAVELGLGREDCALLVMPMCHANSLYFFTTFLYCGGAVAIFSRRSFDPALCLATFGETGASFTSLVPTQYNMLLDVPAAERGRAGFERVRKLMISSAPARVDTKRAVMEMFPNSGLFELYGSTEAAWVTMLHPDEQFDHLGSVGREVVGSAPIRLLDDDGNEVPDGQPGELYSSGPYNFQGYWNNPAKTAEAFRGEFLSVGDIALRDADGFIKLIDRKNNLIISGGENIYPSEVEHALAAHPAVRDVAVVGRPDDKWGESVQAAVVRRAGVDVADTELIAWARERLAGFKVPREIVFLEADEMPRNATGKILHRVLRETLAERREST
ncbi:MAG: AMP-binding protein [Gammaproteobacteria bacterium]|nr:AMP-binding protein [Gammaproteobacteria bacterium]